MTRPQIIRADTIDLQPADAPSAQTHRRLTPDGSIAPHQASTLREVAAETAEEILRSPRPSWHAEPDNLEQHPLVLDSHDGTASTMPLSTQHDALAIAQNGGLSGNEIDDPNMAGDDAVDIEDDLIDRISSSPSIEDGGSPLALPTLPSTRYQGPPLEPAAVRSSSPSMSEASDPGSSSPYLEGPVYLPLGFGAQHDRGRKVSRPLFDYVSSSSRHHHLDGESRLRAISAARPSTLQYEHLDPSDSDDGLSTIPEEDSYIFEDANHENKNVTSFNGQLRGGSSKVYNWRDPPIENCEPHNKRDRRLSINHDGARDDRKCYWISAEDDDLTLPYESAEDDDGDFSDVSDSRFVDSGWGGECLQETEDIDFDFVYALHTFVATVEGQANATKGDTMVLLDDSNSYWWLVRVVKDSSIGYLPAEHIETPTERLARLNKHRNIDLSASMLTDTTEKPKSKNPLKKKKNKTVQFAAPTYVDYTDPEYSDEEENVDDLATQQLQQEQHQHQHQQQQQQQHQMQQQSSLDSDMEDESARVEPLKPRSQQRDTKTETKKPETSREENKTGVRISEYADSASEWPRKTSNGTVRDSFFKDDTVETKKITLTPNLLRDDEPRTSNDSLQSKQRPSLDKLDGNDKKKKKEKEKDKKSGGLRGFFSRRDKRGGKEEEDDILGRHTDDKDEEDDNLIEKPAQRQPSKLQKPQPRVEPSPARRSNSISREPGVDIKTFLSETRLNNVANVPPATMRLVESSPKSSQERSAQDQWRQREQSPGSRGAGTRRKPQSRLEADIDNDESDEDFALEPTQKAPIPDAIIHQQPQAVQDRAVPESQPEASRAAASKISPDSAAAHKPQSEPRAESPVDVSPVDNSPSGLITSEEEAAQDAASSSPAEPVEPEEPPVPVPEAQNQPQGKAPSTRSVISPTTINTGTATGNTTASSSPRVSESWDDVSLRAFFDSGSEIRDMLVLVFDKNNVDPDPDLDNPLASSLFREENAKLAEITTRLDNMLGDWLARKQRLRGTV